MKIFFTIAGIILLFLIIGAAVLSFQAFDETEVQREGAGETSTEQPIDLGTSGVLLSEDKQSFLFDTESGAVQEYTLGEWQSWVRENYSEGIPVFDSRCALIPCSSQYVPGKFQASDFANFQVVTRSPSKNQILFTTKVTQPPLYEVVTIFHVQTGETVVVSEDIRASDRKDIVWSPYESYIAIKTNTAIQTVDQYLIVVDSQSGGVVSRTSGLGTIKQELGVRNPSRFVPEFRDLVWSEDENVISFTTNAGRYPETPSFAQWKLDISEGALQYIDSFTVADNVEKMGERLGCTRKENPLECYSFAESLFVSKMSIPEEVVQSDAKLLSFLKQHFGYTASTAYSEFSRVLRGKLDATNREKEVVLLFFVTQVPPEPPDSFLMAFEKNEDEEWVASFDPGTPHEGLTWEVKDLLADGLSFLVTFSSGGGGTCTSIRSNTEFYWFIGNELQLRWMGNISTYVDGRKGGSNTLELFNASLRYEDLDKDGNIEIIREGTRRICETNDARFECLFHLCSASPSPEEQISSIFLWDAIQQRFMEK